MGWMIMGAIVFALVASSVVVLIVTFRRIRNQRVTVEGDMLITTRGGSATEDRMPLREIGTVVCLPTNPPGSGFGSPGPGLWNWGGIIILDRSGRVARVIRNYGTGAMPLDEISRRIPTPVYAVLQPYTRHRFLKQYPGACGFFALRDPMFWVFGALVTLCVPLPIVALIIAGIVNLATHAPH